MKTLKLDFINARSYIIGLPKLPNPKLSSPISRHMKNIVIASRIMLLIYEGKL
jgi:hypothetical protein